MAIEQLSVKVGADVGGAVTGLATVEKSLSKAADSAEKLNKSGSGVAPALEKIGSSSSAASAGLERVYAKIEAIGDAAQKSKVKLVDLGNARLPLSSINAYNAAILKMKTNLSSVSLAAPLAQVPAAANKAAAGITNLGTQTKKTGVNTLEFARVIQDLPFGFAGISNNLTQLIPGVGALGLAFSAVVAAITFAQIGFGAWTRGFGQGNDAVKSHAKALEEARKALAEYTQSLDAVNKARLIGAQNAQDELVQLKTLYDATQNANIPLATRKKLVDELQDQYPQYFGNIKDEIILAGGAKDAYDKLTTSILQTAKARAGQDLLVDNQKDLLVTDSQLLKSSKEQADILRKINDLKRTGGVLTFEDNRGVQQITETGKQLNKLQAEYNRKNEETNKIIEARKGLVDTASKLQADIVSTVEATPEVLLDPKAKLDKEKAVKKAKKVIEEDLIKPLSEIPFDPPDVFFSKQPEIKLAFQPNKDFAKLVESKFEAIKIQPRANIVPEADIDSSKLLDGVEKVGNELSESFNKIFASGIGNGFANFGESIGAAIASGADPIAAAGASIVGTVGDLITQMGKALIEYGVVKTGLDKVLAGGIIVPGVAAIAAGVAAVAVGALLKNALKPKKFAQGGFVPGYGSGDTVPAMLTPGEYVVRKKDVPKFFSILKMLKSTGGIDLGGMMGFAGGGFVPNVRSVSNIATNSSRGIKSMPTVVPQVVILNRIQKGRDVILQVAREQRSQRRGS